MKTTEISVNESFLLSFGFVKVCKQFVILHARVLPFRFVVGVVLGDGRDGMAQDHIGIIERLLHLHGPIGAPSNIMT